MRSPEAPSRCQTRGEAPCLQPLLAGPTGTSCSRRQLRSLLRVLPPPNPTRASKPRKSNQIGRSDLERFHPWGKGEGTSLFSFSPFELPIQKRPQPTLEWHPSTRIVGTSHLFSPPPPFLRSKTFTELAPNLERLGP